MERIKVAIFGYGNIGRFAVSAVEAAADMELVGVVCPEADTVKGVRAVVEVEALAAFDVVMLCVPTLIAEKYAVHFLENGINTVDCFDIHSAIWDYRGKLDQAARAGQASAIVAAGWDPGSDSVVRALMEACAPRGLTHTNFGPGMSMGHTVAAKAKPGVTEAVSVTIPVGYGVHHRLVYVQLEPGAELAEVRADIKADPYFAHDETHVFAVENVADYIDRGHSVKIERKGVSGTTDNQNFHFSMSINNPALTAQIMTSCARAVVRQAPGAYTMVEIPMIDLLPGDKEKLVRRLV